VGGTAEMFSSLNLGLGDFLILQRFYNEVEYKENLAGRGWREGTLSEGDRLVALTKDDE